MGCHTKHTDTKQSCRSIASCHAFSLCLYVSLVPRLHAGYVFELLCLERFALDERVNELADGELLVLRRADNFVCKVFVSEPEGTA
jgi:hypothetical protein